MNALPEGCAVIVGRRIQTFIGECFSLPAYQGFAHLNRFVDSLPSAADPLYDHPLLRGLLLDFSLTWTARQHARYHNEMHRERVPACTFAPFTFVERTWIDERHRPLTAIRVWADRVTAEFMTAHPESIALQLRDAIDADYALQKSVLVERFSCDARPASRVEADFRALVGVSVHAYLTRRRVATASKLLIETDDKVETIARLVGWKSPKDLYRAITDTTGHTPAALRKARKFEPLKSAS